MATSSISGLASGLDTATIISQLMQLEAVPQARLENRKDAQSSVLTALRQLNTRAATLGSAAATLAKPETWQTIKGTSTSPLISVSTSAAAVATKLSISVEQPAVAHRVTYADSVALDDRVVAGADNTISLTVGSTAHSLSTDGTLTGVAKAINDAGLGVTAATIRTGEGAYRLLVTADEAGSASAFTLTDSDGQELLLGGHQLQQGTGARITVNGIAAESATNSFDGIVPGVTIKLAEGAVGGTTPTAATITVAQDTSTVSSKVKALVDQVNDFLTHLDAQTASGKDTKGVLAGDATARNLRSALLNTVFSDNETTLSDVGLQTDRYGKLVFDEAKFKEAYAADPASVAQRFTTATTGDQHGWAAKLETVAKATSGPDGLVTSAISGKETAIKRLDESIEAWDLRLELRRTTLQRQYTALETALSSMQSQSSWLASQISSLPSWNS